MAQLSSSTFQDKQERPKRQQGSEEHRLRSQTPQTHDLSSTTQELWGLAGWPDLSVPCLLHLKTEAKDSTYFRESLQGQSEALE